MFFVGKGAFSIHRHSSGYKLHNYIHCIILHDDSFVICKILNLS